MIENNLLPADNEPKKEEQTLDYRYWIEAIVMVAKHYRLEVSTENISLTGHWLNNKPMSDVLRSMARQAGLTVGVRPLQ
ncbi:Uncharacterised protein [Oligella ureolytica]|uniref:hypothetical protein n=1 Tax=Oligella ureolytica TaxID=90244 RepID=UPI000E070979|nr:hypothetical protein [Oligella ureolytica]SUA55730.1 Uncharacterised protein [Oligella ureolytica]